MVIKLELCMVNSLPQVGSLNVLRFKCFRKVLCNVGTAEFLCAINPLPSCFYSENLTSSSSVPAMQLQVASRSQGNK
eukprot:1984797-Amphidinium_carterae.1